MISLNTLMEEGMAGRHALYELAEVCKGYKPSAANLKKLQDAQLLDVPSGLPNDSVRNVVLSAVEVEGTGISLSSPVAPSTKLDETTAARAFDTQQQDRSK